jgi:hypothetical protein
VNRARCTEKLDGGIDAPAAWAADTDDQEHRDRKHRLKKANKTESLHCRKDAPLQAGPPIKMPQDIAILFLNHFPTHPITTGW